MTHLAHSDGTRGKWSPVDDLVFAKSDGQFHSATLPSPSTGHPALFFFLLEMMGNHLNKHGKKTQFRLQQQPAKLKGQSHLFTEKPEGERC